MPLFINPEKVVIKPTSNNDNFMPFLRHPFLPPVHDHSLLSLADQFIIFTCNDCLPTSPKSSINLARRHISCHQPPPVHYFQCDTNHPISALASAIGHLEWLAGCVKLNKTHVWHFAKAAKKSHIEIHSHAERQKHLTIYYYCTPHIPGKPPSTTNGHYRHSWIDKRNAAPKRLQIIFLSSCTRPIRPPAVRLICKTTWEITESIHGYDDKLAILI